MAIVDGLPDSQHFLKISTGVGPLNFVKVPLLTNIDMIEQKKTLDEITTTDARNKQQAVVDFMEINDLNFELVYKPTDPQHMALKAAFDNNTVVHCELHFADANVKGFKFDGQVSEFTFVTDVKKKLRVKGAIVVGDDVTEITSVPIVVVP
ncbi:hypothetical protein [Psychrobacter sp. 16-MNA-CIBAN-0192]|uniref:hypothetical protein n=1 Tax=Psychrobacter sp. 16-MNA-CIBAN-0192 TaxID=3140448 RepID=UPI003333ED3C